MAGNQGLTRTTPSKDYMLLSNTKGRVVVKNTRKPEPTWGRLHPRHRGLRA